MDIALLDDEPFLADRLPSLPNPRERLFKCPECGVPLIGAGYKLRMPGVLHPRRPKRPCYFKAPTPGHGQGCTAEHSAVNKVRSEMRIAEDPPAGKFTSRIVLEPQVRARARIQERVNIADRIRNIDQYLEERGNQANRTRRNIWAASASHFAGLPRSSTLHVDGLPGQTYGEVFSPFGPDSWRERHIFYSSTWLRPLDGKFGNELVVPIVGGGKRPKWVVLEWENWPEAMRRFFKLRLELGSDFAPNGEPFIESRLYFWPLPDRHSWRVDSYKRVSVVWKLRELV